MRDRAGWAVIVRLRDIENAGEADAGAFTDHRIGPFAVPPPASRWLATFCVNTTDRIVALTFDDGPHPQHTPRLLDQLAASRATATFFVLAAQVEAHPEIARRIVADGHEIALHGADHRSLLTMPTGEAIRAVKDAKRRVEAIVGTRLRSYRPPYGEYTWQQAVGLRLIGLETIIWSGDSRDWDSDDEEQIIARALESVIPGGILLFHDNRGDPETVVPGGRTGEYNRAEVLKVILDRLKSTRYVTRRVDDMLRTHQRVRSVARYGSSRLGGKA